jgi:DNA replication protein DnaC
MTAATVLYEQLKDDLGYLKLGQAAECFATLFEQARTGGCSDVKVLARNIAEHTSATTNRRLAARLRSVRFPYRWSIDDFDFKFQPSVDRKMVAGLATLRFITENRPLPLRLRPRHPDPTDYVAPLTPRKRRVQTRPDR